MLNLEDEMRAGCERFVYHADKPVEVLDVVKGQSAVRKVKGGSRGARILPNPHFRI